MITCPNCNHQNPDGANQCEACYTPLPSLVACPSCGTEIQADASFCGQCGADLRDEAKAPSTQANPANDEPEAPPGSTISSFPASGSVSAPDSTIKTQNFLDPQGSATPRNPTGDPAVASASTPNNPPSVDLPDLVEPDPLLIPEPINSGSPAVAQPEPPEPEALQPEPPEPEALQPETPQPDAFQPDPPQPDLPIAPTPVPAARPMVTQLQTISVRLRHVQTDTPLEIPRQLSVIRIGKPNDQTPPDIDVSGFPDSEIVSRTHANLRVEGDVYYVEDVGSSNGTYVNGLPLPAGNRHRLRPGDRIALGKGDKVSFIFEAAS